MLLAGQRSVDATAHDDAPPQHADDHQPAHAPAAKKGRSAAAAASKRAAAASASDAVPHAERKHKHAAGAKHAGSQPALPDPEQLRAQRCVLDSKMTHLTSVTKR